MKIILLLASIGMLSAQYTVNPFTRRLDAIGGSSSSSTASAITPATIATLPATCTAGTDVRFVADATVGFGLGYTYECFATNQWRQVGAPGTGTGTITMLAGTAPSNPASGYGTCYINSTTGLTCLTSAGASYLPPTDTVCVGAGSSGSTNLCASVPPRKALVANMQIIWVPDGTAPSGPLPTLNVDGLGAANIRDASGTQLTGSEVTAGRQYLMWYTGSQWRLQAWATTYNATLTVPNLNGANFGGAASVPSGASISATGTGIIAATTVTGFSPAASQTFTLTNSFTATASGSPTVAFGTGGTVAYTSVANTFSTGIQTMVAANLSSVGSTSAPALTFSTDTTTGFYARSAGFGMWTFSSSGTAILELGSSFGITVKSDRQIGWSPSTIGNGPDVAISRVSAVVVAIGTAAAGNAAGKLNYAGGTIYDPTASTGSTNVKYREGAGQSTAEVFGIYANDNTTKRFDVTNNIVTSTSPFAALSTVTATGVIRGNGGYQSSDGTAGATTTCTILSITSITVKNGLITGCS